MSKKPKPILSFKVKCAEGSKLYYEVNIYETLADMRKMAAKHAGCAVAGYDKCLGACTYWTYTPLKPPSTNKIGVISFQKKHLGSEIVSHECAHAACGYLDRKGITMLETGRIGDPHGEELAYAVGFMTRKVYEKLYAEGIIPTG